jgi:anti-sigma B factor antagonist
MEITVTEKDTVAVLTLKGKLDMANAAELKNEVKKQFDRQQRRIHLNMRDVDFINSSGLGTLVSMMKEARVLKGRLTLSNLAPYVSEIFEITQLSNVFEIFGDIEEAMASYRAMQQVQNN